MWSCLSIHGVPLPQSLPLAPLGIASPLQWIMHIAGSPVHQWWAKLLKEIA